jgi:cytochrome c oxidase subunit IV
MAHSSEHLQPGEIPKPQTKAIWNTFWVLLGITAVEFIVALAIPDSVINHTWKVVLYTIMTIAKAGYIVGEFMHLKHEVKFLIYAILLPMVLVVWLLVALIAEGSMLFYGW